MNEIYEIVQLVTGETYLFIGGYKEEADIKDVFKFDVKQHQGSGHFTYDFARFDFNPLTPLENSKIRLNRSAIILAWFINPNTDLIRNLKKTIVKMDVAKSGLIIP